ncbi:hypothetical protein kam1_1573 [Methylacidiphilum kamchatkense Kam1]|uniref:Uncharacterized protein n=3 Tax=Methylacidiphilum kamchatkense TaxID=431057 RepID=A0A516TNH1_9BACT|nr:hypothetical protein kam1_1573 [Methylacidiphilum kamchatkense Kam1]
MKRYNWRSEKRIVFFFLFFLCTVELLNAEPKLSNLLRKPTLDIKDIKNLVQTMTYNPLWVIAENKDFRVQYYPSYHPKGNKDVAIYKIAISKTVYTYTCPSTSDRAIKKIVAVDNERKELIDAPIPTLSGKAVISYSKKNIVITFDGSKVQCRPEDIIKGFGSKREHWEKDGSLVIPFWKQYSEIPTPLRYKFIANRLVELQINDTN